MKSVIVYFNFLFLGNCFSYVPTLHSLLRNGNNVDISTSTVVANLALIEIDKVTNQPISIENNQPVKSVVKFLVRNENKTEPILTQVNYKDSSMNNSSLVNFQERSFGKASQFVTAEGSPDVEIFYSLLAMLLNNKGSLLLNVFKKYNPHFKLNVELADEEKLDLLKKYKTYLEEKKNNADLGIKNPMKPEGIEERESINKIKKRYFLKKDFLVKRVKYEDQFFWVVQTEKVYIKFDINHRLKELRLTTQMNDIEIVFGRFILHGAQMEFPELIWFTDSLGKKYEIKATKLSMFNDNTDSHKKRLKRYTKLSKKNAITDLSIKPSFLLP